MLPAISMTHDMALLLVAPLGYRTCAREEAT